MSNFDLNTIAQLKKLSRIECTPEEEASILNNLSQIIDYMDALSEVDTEHVEPCTHVLSSMLKNQMRKDEVKDILPREQFLSNAPDQIGGMIRVPPVLKD